MFRRLGSKSRLGRLGITLLILSLARVPVPVPDFIGLDRAAPVDLSCPGHDRSLGDPPVKMSPGGPGVYLRWIVLNTAALCGSPSAIGTESANCHPDWTSCEHDPSPHFLHTRTAPRFANPLAIPSIDNLQATLAWRSRASARPAPALLARSFGATYPPRTSLSSLLSRWIC